MYTYIVYFEMHSISVARVNTTTAPRRRRRRLSGDDGNRKGTAESQCHAAAVISGSPSYISSELRVTDV